PRRHLTLVHKTNVLTFAGDLRERTFNAVKAEYPDVATAYNHVDAACIYLVGAVTGGVGFAGTGNLNPDRTSPSMFEPVHGSAHDSVGSDRVNPSSQILSAVMLLEFLGEAEAAARIRKALDDVLASNPVPTSIGDLVAERV